MAHDQYIVSWDGHPINDGVNYTAGFKPGLQWGLPTVGAVFAPRTGRWPVVSAIDRPGERLYVMIQIKDRNNVRTLRDQLCRWFDPEDETPKQLVIEDETGGLGYIGNDRYVYAICEALQPITSNGLAVDEVFVATLAVDGDVRWRGTISIMDYWTVTASGQTVVVINEGTDLAFPILGVTPRVAKTEGFLYKLWCYTLWKADPASNYPLKLGTPDTASLINTATTTTLNGAFNAGAATCTLTDASSFPTVGMAYITDGVAGDEQIRWTGKAGNNLTGCVRGIGGTGDVNHGGGQTIAVSKMLANGDDLRVYVNGVEVDRWINDIDTATTDVWIVLDFQAAQEATLETAIAGAGVVSTITASDDISGFPRSGILMIGSEEFSYSSKSDASRTFLGITRSIRGTSAAVHSVGDPIYWIEHDIQILYGDQTLGAPTVDDDYAPIVELDTSTNDSWVYQEFGETGAHRAGAWTPQDNLVGTTGETYTADRGTDASPWEEVGCYAEQPYMDTVIGACRFYVYNPCGIASANFTNGETKIVNTYVERYITSSIDGVIWVDEYDVVGGAGVWAAWSRNETLDSGSKYVGLYAAAVSVQAALQSVNVEAADVTLTLDTTYTPDVTVSSEQGNYQLDCIIENTTTGDALAVLANVDIDDMVVIDTDNKTVYNATEGLNIFGALTVTGGVRRNWLPLQLGNNTLQYTETGLVDVDIDLEWEERYY